MKIDPRHLEILAAVVDCGGLTEGAMALGKSQPSLSRSLAMLESRLGTRLFEPNKRPLRPTPLCLALAAEGRRVINAGTAASDLVSQFKRGTSGAVQLAGPPIFMEGVVSGMLATFQSEYPDIRIDQSYGYAQDVLGQVATGTLDMGIVPVRQVDVPDGVTATQILKGRNVIAGRVGHPIMRQPAIKPGDIAKYPWIAPPADSPLYHDLRGVLESIGATDFKVGFTGASLSAIVNILEGSDALTVLPYSVVFMLRRNKTLEALSIRIGDPERHLCVALRDDGADRPATRRLANFILAEFASLEQLVSRHEQNQLWRT
ncbi:MAG: LysR family transcriptional regulator [Pseudomonadota bacterium]